MSTSNESSKKVAIIGAGISGLSLGRMLPNHDVVIFESRTEAGGIARVRSHEGVPFHLTGGHCFNSRDEEVLSFVFDKVLAREHWHVVQREAKIYFKGKFITYPIENAFKEILFYWPLLGLRLFFNFLFPGKVEKEASFYSWLCRSFGHGLVESYFVPYNKKIWGRHPREMSKEWIPGKLPQRDVASVLKAFFGVKEKKMIHSHFYYPKKGDGAFVKALAKGQDITYSTKVEKIEKSGEKFIINGIIFDEVVYTGPLNLITNLIELPPEIKDAVKDLKYNKITTCLWKGDASSLTWSYHPDDKNLFHRHVSIGNFLEEKKPNYRITECLGTISKEEILRNKPDGLHELIDFYHSDHAYVVFDSETKDSVKKIKSFVKEEGLLLLGRFAEWEYYNMDICIRRAMDTASEINRK